MIENTKKNHRPDWVMGGNPNAILAQEAEGQKQLCASQQLPKDGLRPEKAAQHGIVIVGPSAGDDLFVDVQLPEGWQIKPTDHSMWSELQDADGKRIAMIFYKAAFYDRTAFIRFEH